ncbi:RsmB/NOP family class I SAM-dependent RNA methyltransferase [Arenibaculum sp.]|uniref:RsmB/NOP family class I SAM-dependent RNA methyltransferase n=1 Tax=Arenibaculum sp. TaxID=2865862 RepID=UPI002E0F8537|nr:RsmB/NOP family class I SAM-dependent RNA methyltransferase [Arenibaculum sp.]
MTPGARHQAAIELLDEVAATPRPADAVISAYFRSRRYIGSKDRSAVAEKVYAVLRRHARLRWWLERNGHGADGRALVIADEILANGRAADAVARSFDGARFSPPPFTPAETRLARALETHTLEHPHMPEETRAEVPDWASGPLRDALGDAFAAEAAALREPAPLDLRVNPVKGSREHALALLAGMGVEAEATRWSPLGIRVRGRPPVSTSEPFRNGLFEIQDEGSQLVALLAGARPGQQVVDFCAGAGGKTLAMAAAMENKGRVIACDVLARRLERAAERFRRAGLHNIETRALSSERDPWVKRHKGRFDRVLVDAPCSGTGTWRRNPDSRWRPLGPGLGELVPLQEGILDSAARLVKPGGRLVYATCSLLPEENDRRVEAFLAAHPEFTVVPMPLAWAETIGTEPPGAGPYLALTPARHETDGFFAAVLERAA